MSKARKVCNHLFYLLAVFVLVACNQSYTPKPRGFFRIDFPEKKYRLLDSIFPYKFEIPEYAVIKHDDRNPDKPNWINVTVPENKAEIHISYYNLAREKKNNQNILSSFMEESRDLAYKHSIKANAINEKVFENNDLNTFALLYDIKGNAASPVQFFITDSSTHFLRGALYIREVPNIDSIQPVIDFLEPDVIKLIETLRWK